MMGGELYVIAIVVITTSNGQKAKNIVILLLDGYCSIYIIMSAFLRKGAYLVFLACRFVEHVPYLGFIK